jgi:hypothetical protein
MGSIETGSQSLLTWYLGLVYSNKNNELHNKSNRQTRKSNNVKNMLYPNLSGGKIYLIGFKRIVLQISSLWPKIKLCSTNTQEI